MTDDQHGDQHGEGTPPSGGRWDPLPQGDYDDGATAFVQLPEGGVDALLASADSPLAAPGHGYVPPQITVAPGTASGTDPAGTGGWGMPSAPVDGTQWHVPGAGQGPAAHQGYPEAEYAQENGYPQQDEYRRQDAYPQQDPYGGAAPYDANAGQSDRFAAQSDRFAGQDDQLIYRPGATGHWDFSASAGAENGANSGNATNAGNATNTEPAPGQDVTGQWSIPVADGDLPDESGEFTPSSLTEQWGTGAPATLPGGAPAPWATQSAGQPWGDRQAEAGPRGGERPADAPRAPESAVGPYAEASVEPALEAGSATPAADETLPGETQGAEEAPGEPAGRPVDMDRDVATRPLPKAVEQPVTGPAPAVERQWAPEPGQEREPGPERARTPEPESGTDVQSGVRADTRTVDRTEPRTEPLAEPRTEPPAEPPADGVADDRSDDRTDGQAAPHGQAAPQAVPQPDPAAAAQERPSAGPNAAGPNDEHPLASYVLRVNGADRPVTDAWIGESLLYVLRERLGLAGAKDGCSQGECGACNVQVDGRLVASCLVPAVTSAGSEVRTVEGLAADGQPSDVQRALARRGAVQCGFCVPGMAMTVHNLLEGNPAPTDLEARQALSGNLCRCSGYRGVLEAVQEVVAERETHAADEAHGQDTEELRIPHQAGPGAGGVNPSAFDSQGTHGTPDTPGPHDHPHGDHPHGDRPRGDEPYGDRPHGQDGGHA